MRVEGAPADAKLYGNLAWGGAFQGTGGSTAIANSYDQLKQAGATARAMLVTAAAKRWNVPASEITIASGVVQHKSGKSARFGELVADAAKLPVPTDVKPKDPSTHNRIGKSAPRVDSKDKSTGKAIYTQDIKLPGMLTAVVAHPPRFGAQGEELRRHAGEADQGREVRGRIRNSRRVPASPCSRLISGRRKRAATHSPSSGTNRTPSSKAPRRPAGGISRAGKEAGRHREAGRGCRESVRVGGSHLRGDVRISVSRARDHGAHELRREARAGQLRDLERRTVPNRRPGDRGEDARPGADGRSRSTSCTPAAASAVAPIQYRTTSSKRWQSPKLRAAPIR